MEGTILRGRFAGMRLEELTSADLLALLRECGAEGEEGARLLEAYLDRVRPHRRDELAGARIAGTGRGNTRSTSGDMSVEEGDAILGLLPGADADAIKARDSRAKYGAKAWRWKPEWYVERVSNGPGRGAVELSEREIKIRAITKHISIADVRLVSLPILRLCGILTPYIDVMQTSLRYDCVLPQVSLRAPNKCFKKEAAEGDRPISPIPSAE
jgi:hypothetical protein